jgi:uncharacterized membrane protein
MAKKRRGSGGRDVFSRMPDPVVEGREIESRPSPVHEYAITRELYAEQRVGPIPDAEEMIRYKAAHPEAPVIILDEFKTEAAHRRTMERRALGLDRRAIEAAIFSERLGVLCALAVALAGFGFSTYLITIGHAIPGMVMFGLDVAAMVSAFILGRQRVEVPPASTTTT